MGMTWMGWDSRTRYTSEGATTEIYPAASSHSHLGEEIWHAISTSDEDQEDFGYPARTIVIYGDLIPANPPFGSETLPY